LRMMNVRGHGEEESARPKGAADLFQNQAFLLQGDVLEHVMGQRRAERSVSKWQRLRDVASDNRKSPSSCRLYAFPRELNADRLDFVLLAALEEQAQTGPEVEDERSGMHPH